MQVYPIFLNRLHSNKTILVGGNEEAERKTGELLDAGARLTVISPAVTPAMQKWQDEGRFERISRGYREGDLEGAFMVIVAEFTGDVNKRVWQEAGRLGILCNVMDDIPHCNFTFGSMVKRGPLNIGISTSGAAPALAVRLRQKFEKEFGQEYEYFLDFMQSIRGKMKQNIPDFEQRREIWYKLIDSEVLGLFRQGNHEEAKKLATQIAGFDTAETDTREPDSGTPN